ncbi:hypothetical protein HC891_24210 [Candidatus Gracilibacteria bacterium]|nr:hypothetical protein [Candidatus Gracilibacteria bacterium]
MALQPDGKVIVAGVRQQTFAVARYTSAGEIDQTFGVAGVVTTQFTPDQQRADAVDVALQPDGKIVVAGSLTGPVGSDFALLRYSAAGALDPSFDGDGKAVVDFDGGDDRATTLGIDGQGRIVVGGAAQLGTRFDFVALRLTDDGALDTSFNDDGKARVVFAGASFATDLLIQRAARSYWQGRPWLSGRPSSRRPSLPWRGSTHRASSTQPLPATAHSSPLAPRAAPPAAWRSHPTASSWSSAQWLAAVWC